MKLKNDFYNIIATRNSDTGADFLVRLNPAHFIYTAHFPGNPITPGVCITQIACELAEELVGAKLFLRQVKNIKFLQIIDPRSNGEVRFSLALSGDAVQGYKVAAEVSAPSVTFAKLSLQFVNGKQ